MRTSVALCTYRGERFLGEQLVSVLRQEVAADELVVSDDASDDGTLSVLTGVLTENPDVPTTVSWHVNPANVGVARNFEACLLECTGDLVFLCDQDDRWHVDKVERLAKEFSLRPELMLVFTDAALIGAEGQSLGTTLFAELAVTERELRAIERRPLDVLIRRNIITGATVVVRREVIGVALPIPPGWLHDEWIALIAASMGAIGCLRAAMIDYRQHGGNQIGVTRATVRSRLANLRSEPTFGRQASAARAADLVERLRSIDAPPESQEVAWELFEFHSARNSYPQQRMKRLRPLAQQLRSGNYRRFARYTTALRDLVVGVENL
jgi:glycosyltransferase involved in cell wall biosynthesis